MMYAFVGFGSFFLGITVICLLGIYFADPLERWAMKRFRKRDENEFDAKQR